MSDANLLKVLEKKSTGLMDIVVYGKVRCAIMKPAVVGGLTESEGFFAIVDVFALQCLGEDYFGSDSSYYDKDRVYFSNGSMLICCSNVSCIGKIVKIGGKTKGKGCTIKRQRYTKNAVEGVHGFVFRKDRQTNKWMVESNTVVPLTKKDIRGTILEDYVTLSDIGVGTYEIPDSTKLIVEYCGAASFVEKRVSVDNVTQGSGIFEYVEDSDDRVDVSNIDMHLVKHMEAQSKSEMYNAIEDEVNDQKRKRERYVDRMLDEVGKLQESLEEEDDFDILGIASSLRDSYVKNIASLYSMNISTRVKEKNKVFVDSLVSSFYDAKFTSGESGLKDVTASKALINEGVDRIKKSVAEDPNVLTSAYSEFLPLLKDDLKIASLMIGNVTGVGESSIVSSFNSCNRYYGIDLKTWFFMLVAYPYELGMLGRGLKVVDCDKIYLSVGRSVLSEYLSKESVDDNFKLNMKYRNYLMVLEGIKKLENSSQCTLVMKSIMKSRDFDFYPEKERRNFKEYGTPLPLVNSEVTKRLVNIDFLPLDYRNYTEKNPCTDYVLRDLEMSGVVDSVNSNYLALSKNMLKEFEIYKVLQEKGTKETGVTPEVVEKAISVFEEKKGFSLEPLQKDGAYLVMYKAAVLSGCAGSGKTTTSDLMTEILKSELKNYEVVYGTPTGKACRRLAEVVGGTVKTLNSLFGVGIESEPYLSPVYPKKNNTGSKKAYIFDEMAMCNTDLLYEVVKNLGDEDITYFLGDIKQLPPIGRGIPFSMLMSILPCVELGVSKRSASGSLVNYNTTLINFLSDGKLHELKYDNTSFVKVECDDTMLATECCEMFKGLLKGNFGKRYEEDDIQVITEYQTPKKLWSAPILNVPIQDYLRSNDKLLFYNVERKFYQNDRVIHLKRNSYEMRRYIKQGFDTFIEVPTFGAVNGEVGKLVTAQRSDMVNIEPLNKESFLEWYVERGMKTADERLEKEAKSISEGTEVSIEEYIEKNKERFKENLKKEAEDLIQKHDEKEEDLRDDEGFQDSDFYFVEVKYYDNDLKTDVIVLYRAHLKGNESTFGEDGEKYFAGGDLENLDLAYALTAHKMQGSQAKAVIAVFGKGCSSDFVNRNMINVIITRSEEFVGMIGSITGSDSAITQGRLKISPRKRDDILGILAGEVKV